jgi:glycosyltransferase involved in cell wall biosynthesis
MHVGISSLMIQRGKTGVAQYLFGLLHGLDQRVGEEQFTVFILQDDLPLFASFESSMRLVAVPENYREPYKNILWHHQYLPRLVREHRLDVLHIPSYRRLLWQRPCPLVATIHDLAPFRVPDKYDWKRMFYGRVVVRWLARRQDRIIAVSQNTANDLAQFFRLPANRVQVIHNGLDHHRFSPAPPERAKQWAKKRFGLEAPFFLYVARLEHPAKNHLRLISAFEQFHARCHLPWQLVFAGSDWHGAEAIHAAIHSSPQRQRIRSLGFVPDQELPDLYRAADAFIYPSLYEGFGLPPIEAMACGCPVISSVRGSLAEVIGSAALTVDPENVSGIAEKMLALATGLQSSEALRSAGLAQAKKFDWRRTASETVRVYEQAADRIRLRQPGLDSAPNALGAAP